MSSSIVQRHTCILTVRFDCCPSAPSSLFSAADQISHVESAIDRLHQSKKYKSAAAEEKEEHLLGVKMNKAAKKRNHIKAELHRTADSLAARMKREFDAVVAPVNSPAIVDPSPRDAVAAARTAMAAVTVPKPPTLTSKQLKEDKINRKAHVENVQMLRNSCGFKTGIWGRSNFEHEWTPDAVIHMNEDLIKYQEAEPLRYLVLDNIKVASNSFGMVLDDLLPYFGYLGSHSHTCAAHTHMCPHMSMSVAMHCALSFTYECDERLLFLPCSPFCQVLPTSSSASCTNISAD